jgi:hypothetical protein
MSRTTKSRRRGRQLGQALIDAMQASPRRDIEIAPSHAQMPVLDVALWRAAMEVEKDERLAAEMTEWDGTVADG